MCSRQERANTPSAIYAQKRRDNENEARELLRARIPNDIIAESLARRCDFNITTKVLAHALKCFDDSASLPDPVQRSDCLDTGAYNRIRRNNEQTITDSLKRWIPDTILAEGFMKLPHFNQTTKVIIATCKFLDQIRDTDPSEAQSLEGDELYDADILESEGLGIRPGVSLKLSKTPGTFVHNWVTSRPRSCVDQLQYSVASSPSKSTSNTAATTTMSDQIQDDAALARPAEPIWKCIHPEAAARAANCLIRCSSCHNRTEGWPLPSKDTCKTGEKRKLPSVFQGLSDHQNKKTKTSFDEVPARFHPVLEVRDFETAAKSLVSGIKQMLEPVNRAGFDVNDARVRGADNHLPEIPDFTDEDSKLLESIHDALVDARNTVKAIDLRRRAFEDLKKCQETWKRSGLLQEE